MTEKHVHQYVLKSVKYKWRYAYEFYECVAPGKCDKPDKMKIRDRRKDE